MQQLSIPIYNIGRVAIPSHIVYFCILAVGSLEFCIQPLVLDLPICDVVSAIIGISSVIMEPGQWTVSIASLVFGVASWHSTALSLCIVSLHLSLQFRPQVTLHQSLTIYSWQYYTKLAVPNLPSTTKPNLSRPTCHTPLSLCHQLRRPTATRASHIICQAEFNTTCTHN